MAYYSGSAELKLTLLCVRLIVAVVLPAYMSTIQVVLRLIFARPVQSLVAVVTLSRDSLAHGSNFQMLTRSFTR